MANNKTVLKAGQIWSYKSRENEKHSTISIVHMESDIIHILIQGINLKTPNGTLIKETFIPILRSALEESIIDNITSLPGNYFERIFLDWKENNNTSGQGYFTIPISRLLY